MPYLYVTYWPIGDKIGQHVTRENREWAVFLWPVERGQAMIDMAGHRSLTCIMHNKYNIKS